MLEINPTTVALEAGRSRSLNAGDAGGRYPHVRQLVKQVMAETTAAEPPMVIFSQLMARLLQKRS